jgi:hypothetical protein
LPQYVKEKKKRRRTLNRRFENVLLLIILGLSSFMLTSVVGTQTTAVTARLSGTITNVPQGLTLKYSTDFENITKTTPNSLSMPIANSFNLGAVAGGAIMWLEDGNQTTNSPIPHSGNRCIGMETTASERNEFNLFEIQSFAGQQYYVSEWLYLPQSWAIPATHWYSICAPFQAERSPYLPVAEIDINNWSTNQISLLYGGGPWTTLNTTSGLPPVGQWFKFSYYVKLSTTDGVVKVWVNDTEILSATGTDTWGETGTSMITTIAKIYGGDGQGTLRMWVDDLMIYGTAT